MDMYIFMGIMDQLSSEGKDLSEYTLRDIKILYRGYMNV